MSSPGQSTDATILADGVSKVDLADETGKDRDDVPGIEDPIHSEAVEEVKQEPLAEVCHQASQNNIEGAHTEPIGSFTGNKSLAKGVDGISHTMEAGHEGGQGLGVVVDPMESSTATLKPDVNTAPTTPTHELLSPDDQHYQDPTPKTPVPSQPPSRSTSHANTLPVHAHKRQLSERSPTRSDAGFDDKNSASEDERETNSRTEIQTIMNQFSEDRLAPDQEETMSAKLESAGPLLGSPMQHPPRKSSLEPLNAGSASSVHNLQEFRQSLKSPSRSQTDIGPAVPPKPGSIRSFGGSKVSEGKYSDNPLSPPLHRPPPPEPEPEPDLPFDFHRFLEQLRHKTADPVAKFLRSFLQEFGKKQWQAGEQQKIIRDFLAFITNKMAQCEVWREVSDAEFDNAREGMEKLVMNRLYTQTFSPAIPPPQPIPGSRPKRRGAERPMGPGRRGQHQEDVERDEILAQKIRIYSWVKEEHLEIPPVGDSGKRFLILAQQELLKIKTYRAPRDKIICVLNCCKVIFGLLKHSKSDGSADSFIPLLIYVVLQANPDHLVSNFQYINRFRNEEKLRGEAGYYLNSLESAIHFIEHMDRSILEGVTDEEFEKYVEAAVAAIAEKHEVEVQAPAPKQISEKSALSRPEVTPRHSMEGESSVPQKSSSSNGYESGDGMDEKASMSGLLSAIQRPLSSIGRIFSEDNSSNQAGPARTPLPGNTPRISPRISSDQARSPERIPHARERPSRNRMGAEEAAARQASAEAAEAHRVHLQQHDTVVETLTGMFPDLDREIISDVIIQKEGRIGLAVEACLALSN